LPEAPAVPGCAEGFDNGLQRQKIEKHGRLIDDECAERRLETDGRRQPAAQGEQARSSAQTPDDPDRAQGCH
jgi:hypothetical protein